jgi:hypothetical protein
MTTAPDWKAFLDPRDAVSALLAGRNCSFVPSMPICQDTAWLPFCHQRIIEKWVDLLDARGADGIELRWEDYVRIRVEVYEEIFRHYTPAPSWFALPVQASRAGLEGSRIARRGDELFHLTRAGRVIRMGNFRKPSAEAILEGSAGLEPTWDSTLGFASFKDHGAWHPPANRVEEFRKGIPYHIAEPDDPDALGEGDIIDVEDWIPRGAFRAVPAGREATADEILASGLYDVVQAVAGRTNGQQAPYGGGTSPFQNSCYELGFEGLMESMVLEPDLVRSATAKYLPRPSPAHEAMKRAGVGIIYLFQMFGGGDLFGPRQFEEFVAPVVKQALDFYHERGFRVVYYPMGNATPHLGPMRELDWDALSLEESRRDYVIDIGEVRRVMGPDRVLFGNVATDLIEHGTREQLIGEARRQIRSAAEHGNFILSCGTPIAPGTPAERVRLFCELPKLI